MKKTILLFDGVCNLCNNWVQFVINRNKSRSIVFSSLQSDSGQELLKAHNLAHEDFDSLVVFHKGKVYKKSKGVFILVSKLDFPWPILGVFRIIPTFISNKVYDLIARNRYNLFGKKDQCMLPDESTKDRFLK